jgi:hypothetical protein
MFKGFHNLNIYQETSRKFQAMALHPRISSAAQQHKIKRPDKQLIVSKLRQSAVFAFRDKLLTNRRKKY